MGDKIFQEGLNISEIFVPGVQINYPGGPNILIYLYRGN